MRDHVSMTGSGDHCFLSKTTGSGTFQCPLSPRISDYKICLFYTTKLDLARSLLSVEMPTSLPEPFFSVSVYIGQNYTYIFYKFTKILKFSSIIC